jgi:hypothetical protein
LKYDHLKIFYLYAKEDPGKDMVLVKKTFEIKCPSKTRYEILESKDGKTKAKLKIFAKKTLY